MAKIKGPKKTKALEVAPENWSHRVQIEQVLNDIRARLDSL